MKAAHSVAEWLRQAIAEGPLLTETEELGVIEGGVQITCSIGLASYQEHVGLFGDLARRQMALLRLADTAMYEAKALGKNRVQVASSED